MTQTYIGNCVADAELRVTPSGISVASFTIAIEHRKRVGDKWETVSTTFLRCSIWRDAADRCAESVRKGDRVVVVGTLKSREYEKDGEKRVAFEVDAEEVALSAKFATVTANRAARGSSGGFGGAAIEDPWASSASTEQAPF